MNKRVKTQDVETVIRNCSEVGIQVACFFLIGYVNETEEDFQLTLGFIIRNRRYIHDVFPGTGMQVIPGSTVYEKAQDYGIVLPPNSSGWYTVNGDNTPNIRKDRLERFNQLLDKLYSESTAELPASSEVAEKAQSKKDLITADATLKEALDLSPDDPQFIVAYGAALLRQGETEAARREFVKATVLAPDYVAGHVNLAAAQLSQGNPSAASASIRRALALDPEHAEAQHLAKLLSQSAPGPSTAVPEREIADGGETKPTLACVEVKPSGAEEWH